MINIEARTTHPPNEKFKNLFRQRYTVLIVVHIIKNIYLIYNNTIFCVIFVIFMLFQLRMSIQHVMCNFVGIT